MALDLLAVEFDVPDVPATVAFWAGLLDRTDVPDGDGVLVPGTGNELGLRFAPAGPPTAGRNRLHLHLTSTGVDDQLATVRRALDLGGSRLDVGQLPEEKHIVLADPAGNEFCVIEPDNPFLAGCGFLAEVTCDGSRQAGFFWRDALGWELVWDRDAQIALQSPSGGPKLSWDSWDGPSFSPQPGPARQRFVLAADDPTAEAARLAELGATTPTGQDGADRDGTDQDSAGQDSGAGEGIELADPDGRIFTLRQR